MQTATSSVTSKRSKRRRIDQFDLFAVVQAPVHSVAEASPRAPDSDKMLAPVTHDLTQPDPVQSIAMRPQKKMERVSLTAQAPQRHGRRRPVEVHIVSESDLPNYSDAEKAIVDRTLEALPQTKAWFTYVDIRQAFTISRATVVRRVKSGVVPGIRFAGDRVLEDGSIRRFTREQVRYLLLAIRRR